MSEWIELDSDELNPPRHADIKGVDVMVFLSPYEVPDAVRGALDQRADRFAIDFRYLGSPDKPNEPLETEAGPGHRDITLKVGRNSQRLYRIEIDVKKLKADRVRLTMILEQVKEALHDLAARRTKPGNCEHYDLAEKVISEKKDELLKDLVMN